MALLNFNSTVPFITPKASSANPVITPGQYKIQAGPQLNASAPSNKVPPPAPTQSASQFSLPDSGGSVNSGSASLLGGAQAYLDSISKQLEEIKNAKNTQTDPNPELTKARTESNSILGEIKTSMDKLGGQADRYKQLTTEYGLDQNLKQIQQNSLDIQSKLAEYKAAKDRIEGQAIPMEHIIGETERLERVYGTQVGILEAFGNTLRGNYDLANNRIKDIIDNEFKPEKERLSNLKTFFDINWDILSAEEKKVTESAKNESELAMKKLEQEQKNYETNLKYAFDYAKETGSMPNIDYRQSPEDVLKQLAPGLKNASSKNNIDYSFTEIGGQRVLVGVDKSTGAIVTKNPLGATGSTYTKSEIISFIGSETGTKTKSELEQQVVQLGGDLTDAGIIEAINKAPKKSSGWRAFLGF